MNKLNRKRGFTLVELSIVLVIIGLLIGGIIVANSMIGTTKVQAQIRQIEQFDAAVAGFKAKYNSIPGDSAFVGCSSGKCGDGYLDDWFTINIGGGSSWYWSDELPNFWPNLSAAGFTQDGAAFTATLGSSMTSSGNPRNLPAAPISPKASVIVGSSTLNPIGDRRTLYVIADNSLLSNADTNIQPLMRPSMTPAQALALDKKLDDGIPMAGMVYATIVIDAAAGNFFWFGQYGGGSTCNTNNTTYAVSNPDTTCAVAIRVLNGTGGAEN